MDYSKITLGELLSDKNETIRRNAISILKQLQAIRFNKMKYCTTCGYVEAQKGFNCKECKDELVYEI